MCRQIANPVFIGIDILFDRQQRKLYTNMPAHGLQLIQYLGR